MYWYVLSPVSEQSVQENEDPFPLEISRFRVPKVPSGESARSIEKPDTGTSALISHDSLTQPPVAAAETETNVSDVGPPQMFAQMRREPNTGGAV